MQGLKRRVDGEHHRPMDALSRILLAVAIALVAAALAWGAWQLSEEGRYTLYSSSGLMLLLDSKTGDVERYWREQAQDGKGMKEGFGRLERIGTMRGMIDFQPDPANP
jgi:hypothetical protein